MKNNQLSWLESQWYAVALSKKVTNKPLSVYLFDVPIVIYRHQGKISAMLDSCPHRGIKLSKGRVTNDGHLQCAYHGFEVNQQGQFAKIPGRSRTSGKSSACLCQTYHTIEKDGLIWLTLDTAENIDSKPLFNIPEYCADYPHFYYQSKMQGKLVDVVENFLDPLHTHFVHTGVVRSGKEKMRHDCDVQVRSVEQGYQATYFEGKPQTGLISKLFGSGVEHAVGRVSQGAHISLEYNTKDSTKLLAILHVTPTKGDECQLFIQAMAQKSKVPFWFKKLFFFPLCYLAMKQDAKVLKDLHESIQSTPDFKPLKLEVDIMRPYIEKCLAGEFEEVSKDLVIKI